MLTLLPQVLTVLAEYEMVVFGAVMILTMIFLPDGLLPTLAAVSRRERHEPAAGGNPGKEFGGVQRGGGVS